MGDPRWVYSPSLGLDDIGKQTSRLVCELPWFIVAGFIRAWGEGGIHVRTKQMGPVSTCLVAVASDVGSTRGRAETQLVVERGAYGNNCSTAFSSLIDEYVSLRSPGRADRATIPYLSRSIL